MDAEWCELATAAQAGKAVVAVGRRRRKSL
jgi:hypothetical protein